MRQAKEGVRSLSEPDLYGYSKWLASHLGFDFAPKSLRGFQHGWIWWRCEDADYAPGFGLDPNLDEFWGCLVQDENVERYLRSRGVYAKACGLPFLNFYKHCGLQGSFSHARSGSTLYVPTHSNPWNIRSGDILRSAVGFNNKYKNCSIMLAWDDRQLAQEMRAIFGGVEIGAGALDVDSFYRLMNIFERYEYMITDAPGSHICYALACGMKVGIHQGLYLSREADAEDEKKTIDYNRILNTSYFEAKKFISSIDYLEKIYPGIVIDGGSPSYSKFPELISQERPDVIADYLGWGMTYDSEVVKKSTKSL